MTEQDLWRYKDAKRELVIAQEKLREYEELASAVDESYIPPDLKAGTFWLKNRQPERWQERSEKEQDEEETVGGIVEIPMADTIDMPDV